MSYNFCNNGCCKYEVKTYEKDIFTPRNKKKAGVFIHDAANNKILLVQSRGNLWGPPKGSVEHTETIINCARREVLEETGITLTINDISESNCFTFNDSHYFYCDMIEAAVTLETPMLSDGKNDASGIGWFKINCLQDLINTDKIQVNYHCKLLFEYFLKISL